MTLSELAPPAEGASNDGTYTVVGYNPRDHELFVDRTHSGNTGFSPQFPARTAATLAAVRGPLDLDILEDRSPLEVFAQYGEMFYPLTGTVTPVFFAPDDRPGRIMVELWNLRSAWNQPQE